MSISQSCACGKKELWSKCGKDDGSVLNPFYPRSNKTSRSGFVYCRYFPIKEKVGGKRGLKPSFVKSKRMYKVVPIILQA